MIDYIHQITLMMRYLSFLLIVTFFVACQNTPKEEAQTASLNEGTFEVQTKEQAELQYQNLRLYPIQADQDFLNANQRAANFSNLKEAMENQRFRLTEKKPYGRFGDAGAVNRLTLQNKSQDTIFIMAGDVVQGGKQDRVIAQDLVVPPRTLTDIDVYCVEQGRWTYQENGEAIDDQAAEKNKKIYAFTGYYNVASNDIRKTVKTTKNQDAIWEKVGEVTAIHNATNVTSAYTGLEEAEDFTTTRDEYLRFFHNKMDGLDNVIGIVAVSGNQVLGTDIFGHPTLFKKQYEALLHSYITDAISNGATVTMDQASMDTYAEKLQANFLKEVEGSDTQFRYEGVMVHFTDF